MFATLLNHNNNSVVEESYSCTFGYIMSQTPSSNLRALQTLFRSSRKQYASIGRRIRPHLDARVKHLIDDEQLGRKVATLLKPWLRKQPHRSTRRYVLRQYGGARSYKQTLPTAARAESRWRTSCIAALKRKQIHS